MAVLRRNIETGKYFDEILICENCGKKFWWTEEEMCVACPTSLCIECHREYDGICDPCAKRAKRMTNTQIKLIQGVYALKQLRKQKGK